MKKTLEEIFIGQYQSLFDRYSELKVLPVFYWGRYYKYECAGEKFGEGINSWNKLYGFNRIEIEDITIDWDLLDRIEEELSDEEFEEYELSEVDKVRKLAVKKTGFDSRAGMCICIVKDANGYLSLEYHGCDSGE